VTTPPDLDGIAPRDVVSYSPPGGTFRKADYPWLVAIRVTARGGDGGGNSAGEPGGPGETLSRVILATDLADEETVAVGAGGHAAPGGRDGADGYILVELFDTTGGGAAADHTRTGGEQ
jgi:hypothetical protein